MTKPTTNIGTELLATWRRTPLSLTANYVYVHARQFKATGYEDAPLTPRHAAGLVGVWEREGVGRAGVEWYYTGRQRLEATINPLIRPMQGIDGRWTVDAWAPLDGRNINAGIRATF